MARAMVMLAPHPGRRLRMTPPPPIAPTPSLRALLSPPPATHSAARYFVVGCSSPLCTFAGLPPVAERMAL
eukprot:2718961-Prymnesium_polylepis.1